jgi:four helix bundle protein
MDPPRKNVLKDKSYAFALRTIKLSKHLAATRKEYVLSKEVLRSGTSIGANVAEANQAQSRPDFVSKLSIALKEATETEYWIHLLRDSGYLTKNEADSLLTDCTELVRLLTAIIKTTRNMRP